MWEVTFPVCQWIGAALEINKTEFWNSQFCYLVAVCNVVVDFLWQELNLRESQRPISGAAEQLLSLIVTAPPVSGISMLSVLGTRDAMTHVMFHTKLSDIWHGCTGWLKGDLVGYMLSTNYTLCDLCSQQNVPGEQLFLSRPSSPPLSNTKKGIGCPWDSSPHCRNSVTALTDWRWVKSMGVLVT